MHDPYLSSHLPPGLTLRAFGYKDAGNEKDAAEATWESRAKRELTHAWEMGEEMRGEGMREEEGREGGVIAGTSVLRLYCML